MAAKRELKCFNCDADVTQEVAEANAKSFLRDEVFADREGIVISFVDMGGDANQWIGEAVVLCSTCWVAELTAQCICYSDRMRVLSGSIHKLQAQVAEFESV